MSAQLRTSHHGLQRFYHLDWATGSVVVELLNNLAARRQLSIVISISH